MEPKFVHFIKFNGYLIVALVCYSSFLRTVEWLALLQTWYGYPSQQGWLRRDHPIVAGVLLLSWITVAAFLYQGLNLEVEAFVLPIGYLFALEVLIVTVQDVISTWNNDADERFLRDGQDVVMWAVAVVYFYYTLYILRRLFRSRQRAADLPSVTVIPEYSTTTTTRKPIYPLAVVQ
ncbi:uncharacterized protein LOC125956667 [Anopheles darlingi]|uniref:uncharacterized protein LOC125956667 n=1 Tax=Anopheles darlingi TaxID=43151 RepID=UPI002100072C|nr:uncharacterized protein LOC125956667 [Anopheles darlingi]